VSEKTLVAVPQSYLGLSLDLNDIEGVAHPDFIGFIRHLTQYDTGTMVRGAQMGRASDVVRGC
jgi:hypothetical protein